MLLLLVPTLKEAPHTIIVISRKMYLEITYALLMTTRAELTVCHIVEIYLVENLLYRVTHSHKNLPVAK